MDKVLLVTGGGRGIGAATARLAAARGYAVCVNYRSDGDAAARVVAAIEAAGGRAAAIPADVGIETDVVRLFQECDQRLGPLSALVNCAGIIEKQMRVEDMDAFFLGNGSESPRCLRRDRAVNRNDGSILWKHKISNALITNIIPVTKNKVIVTSMDGKVTFLEY